MFESMIFPFSTERWDLLLLRRVSTAWGILIWPPLKLAKAAKSMLKIGQNPNNETIKFPTIHFQFQGPGIPDSYSILAQILDEPWLFEDQKDEAVGNQPLW